MSYSLGATVRSTFRTFSDPERTIPADPTTATVTVHPPGDDPVVQAWPADPEVVRESLGVFHYDTVNVAEGHYELLWQAAGAVVASWTDSFDVRPAYQNLVSVQDVRLRLNKTLTVDDDEIRDMLDAAVREYTEYVGPVGSVTETLSGGGDRLILRAPVVAEITAAAYADGTVIDVDDLTVDNGIVYWGYGTAGFFTWGTRNVTVTYTVGDLPVNHREVIIADVAGYFEASQGGTSSNPGAFPGEGFDEAPYRSTPMVLFPRIRALAPPRIA